MRVVFACGILFAIVAGVLGQPGTCGGDCFFSEDCALSSGDLTCRCSYFHCRVIPDGTCGGGCISDSQCQRWAGGDPNCKCGALFECIDQSEMDMPGYDTYVKFLMSARGSAYRKKVDEMMRLQQLKGNSH